MRLIRVACLLAAAACSSSGGAPSGSGRGGQAGGTGGAAGDAPGGGAGGAAGAAPVGGTGGSSLTGDGGAGEGGGAGTTPPPPLLLPPLVTSAEGAYWKTDGPLTEVTSGAADVTVDDGAVAQRWDGFGGTFSERSGDYLSRLSASDQQTALQLLFGTDGLRFNRGRIPIGASDYAIDRYTLDETPGDTSMSMFSIERDKQKLIPYIKAALAVAPGLHLWASPWSPPTWMKTNGTFDSGNMKEDDATLQAYALYVTKFVQEYGKLGIPIEVVHPQKEPNLALDFPSCVWSPTAMTKFIGAHLGPMFADQNVSAQIFLGSLSTDDRSSRALAIMSAVTADAAAMKYVKGFGFEWDGIPLVTAVKSMNLPIWQDNHNVGNLPWAISFRRDAAPNDHAYAVSSWGFIRDWIRAGVNTYFTSSMILDSVGLGIGTTYWPENALLVVNASNQLVVTPAYHLFRHLSPYVDPGAYVVGTTGGNALAFKNPDGSIVVVLYNSGAAKTTIVAIAGKKLQFELPANGWATVKAK
jgi:glucosylceramidase